MPCQENKYYLVMIYRILGEFVGKDDHTQCHVDEWGNDEEVEEPA
jgi:hypothetical protein